MLSPIRFAQGRLCACHPERSEGSLFSAQGKLREASLHCLRINAGVLLPPFDRLTVRLCSLSLSGVEGRAVSEVERRLRDQGDVP